MEPPTGLVNVTISSNHAKGSGGGIFAHDASDVSLRNITVRENHADYDMDSGVESGGGLYVDGGNITIWNSILAGNRVDGVGGVAGADCTRTGMAAFSTSYSLLGVNNSDSTACDFTSPGDMQGFPGIPLQPGLAPLLYNGGSTATYALMLGSPALDGGNPAGCTNPNGTPLLTDQRGYPRPVGEACDMGAYEHQQPYGNFLPLIAR